MSDTAFFVPSDAGLLPTPSARSPWSPDMLHGRLLGGLAVRQVLGDHGDPALRVSRVTVDLYRFPPMVALRVRSRIVRDGRRIRVVDAEVETAEGTGLARASVVLLRAGEQPAEQPWSPREWGMPHPDALEPPPPSDFPMQMRPAPGGGFRDAGQRKVWLRDDLQLIAGEELAPATRAVMAADLASPLSNSGTGGLDFINADITLYLARPPTGEWLGLEVTGHVSADGIATGQCRMYDLEGAVGYSIVCALATARMQGPE